MLLDYDQLRRELDMALVRNADPLDYLNAINALWELKRNWERMKLPVKQLDLA